MLDTTRWKHPWRDAGGVEHPPACASPELKRVVSLVPSLTETLVAVGARKQLAGITAFCTRPADLLHDPSLRKVGGTKRFGREKLLALKPDLVLLNLEENELGDIDFLKVRVPCYINGVKTVRDGIETILDTGALLNAFDQAVMRAEHATLTLDTIEARVAHYLRNGGVRRRVWYPIWRDPWMTPGPDTFIAAHLRTLGAEAVPELPGPSRYPEMDLDQVVVSRPDTVWLPDEPFCFGETDAQGLRADARFSGVPVTCVTGDHICWFGYRQIEGLAYAYKQLWQQSPEDGEIPVNEIAG